MVMAEKHSISIDGKLYSDLKEYCDLNGLKLNLYTEELIRKQFSIEKFGATPFDMMEKPAVQPVEKTIIDEFYDKAVNGMNAADKVTEKVVESVGGPEKMSDIITDLVFDEKKEENQPKPKRKVTRLN